MSSAADTCDRNTMTSVLNRSVATENLIEITMKKSHFSIGALTPNQLGTNVISWNSGHRSLVYFCHIAGGVCVSKIRRHRLHTSPILHNDKSSRNAKMVNSTSTGILHKLTGWPSMRATCAPNWASSICSRFSANIFR